MDNTLVEIIDLPLLLVTYSIYLAFQMFVNKYDYSLTEIIFSLFYFSVGWLIVGLFIVYTNKNKYINKKTLNEGFANTGQCPNILLQKNNKFYLKNTNLAEIPGINPIEFNNLDEYVRYTNWQRSQGIDCDILYVQEEYDTQGNGILVQRESPLEKEGGMPVITGLNLVNTNNHSKLLDANMSDPPFNNDQIAGYDPDDQYIGLITPLDKMSADSIDNVKGNYSKTSINNLNYKTEWPDGMDVKKYTIGNQSGQIILKQKGETPGASLN